MQADGGGVFHPHGGKPRHGLPRYGGDGVVPLGNQRQRPGGIDALHGDFHRLPVQLCAVGQRGHPGEAALKGSVLADACTQGQGAAALGVQHGHGEMGHQVFKLSPRSEGLRWGGGQKRLIGLHRDCVFVGLGLAQHHRHIEYRDQQRRRDRAKQKPQRLLYPGGMSFRHGGQLLSAYYNNGCGLPLSNALTGTHPMRLFLHKRLTVWRNCAMIHAVQVNTLSRVTEGWAR